MDNNRSNILLKAGSVLMLFASFVRFFFSFTFLRFYSTALTMKLMKGYGRPFCVFIIILSFAASVMMVVVGLIGAISCEERFYAKRCIWWGIASMILCVASNILQIIVGYGTSAITWITAVVIPVVFIAGALVFMLIRPNRKAKGEKTK